MGSWGVLRCSMRPSIGSMSEPGRIEPGVEEEGQSRDGLVVSASVSG